MRAVFVVCFALLAAALPYAAAQPKPVPADPELSRQIWSSVEQARADGNAARALRELSKLLEVYPNEPMARAPIYLAMSELSAELGDSDKAAAYRATALAIDPDLGRRIHSDSGGKRAAADKLAAILATGAQMTGQILQIARQPQPAVMAPGTMPAFPAAPAGMPGAPAVQPMQPAPGGFAAPVVVGYDANNQPIYATQPAPPPPAAGGGPMSPGGAVPLAAPPPQAPVVVGYDANNQPIYAQQLQPQVGAGGGPMSPAPPVAAAPMQQYPAAPAPVAAAPMQQYPAAPAPIAAAPMQQYPAAPAPIAAPMQQYPAAPAPIAAAPMQQYPAAPAPIAAAPPMQQYPVPAAPVAAPSAQPYPAAPRYNPNAWGSRVNPYAMRSPNGRAPRTRGYASPVLKVYYDRSRAGDAYYFANPCPALLDIDGEGALVVTPGCGEEPLVIPSPEITALRMNVAVGREVGAFHIETAKGLYLMLTAETGARDSSLAAVRTLRDALHLSD